MISRGPLGKWKSISRLGDAKKLGLLVAAAVAFAGGIAAVVRQEVVTFISLGSFVAGVCWFLLTILDKTQSLESGLDRLRDELGLSPILGDADALFGYAQKLVSTDIWERVDLYAPIGLWYTSEPKDRWLRALRLALIQGRVKQLSGVFGSPPLDDTDPDRLCRSVARLKLLAGLRDQELSQDGVPLPRQPSDSTINLRFLPVPRLKHPTAAPGMGGVFFRHSYDRHRDVALWAFTTQETGLSVGFQIRHPQAADTVTMWFASQVMPNAGARSFVLVGSPNTGKRVGFDEGLKKFLSQYPQQPASQVPASNGDCRSQEGSGASAHEFTSPAS